MPSIVHYRKFKDFCNDSFIKDTELLLPKLCDQQNVPFKILKESVNITLDKHAPLNKRYVGANQSPFMSKKLSKEIMKRSRLRNKFLNTKSDTDRKAYNKQRNYVVSLLRNDKKNFYSNLNTKIVIDNRTFWKTVKPFLSEKVTIHSKINLVEDDKIISRDDQIAKMFSEYFISIPILNMQSNGYKCPHSSEQDPILKIFDKYKDHPSIKLINAKNSYKVFKFRQIDIEEVKKIFQSLDAKKAAQKDDIKTNLLKKNVDFFAKYTCDDINDSIRSSKFPNELKQADIVPAHKKRSKLSKENCKPIRILPNVSKIYERCLYDQIATYLEHIFSRYQCGFCKGYSAQQCFLAMIEKWKKTVDNGVVFGALLTNLSKAFDCIPHDLIIAKLEACGFHINALKLIHDYLSNRKQRVKVNDAYSSWKDIFYGVPQGSILSPLLFNIHICDLFYFLKDLDIANYADDTTIYIVSEKKESVIRALETSSSLLFGWFNNNFMKANSDKSTSHLIMSCAEATTAVIDGSPIDSSKTEVLQGITIDHELKFDDHVNRLCKKAILKLNALARIAPFMSVSKKRIIINSFIESRFRYCPLIWMFHSRGLNHKINRFHERALRITYNDKSSSYGELLTKDRSVTIHHRNIRALAIEIYKVVLGISLPLLNEVFVPRQCSYELRGNSFLERRRVKSVRYGTESISSFAPKIWEILPNERKDSDTLQIFIAKIKKWVPVECPCRLCKIYLPQVGFILEVETTFLYIYHDS